MIDIRPNPDEVDAAWLTEVVAKRGFTGEVTDFKAESIGCLLYTSDAADE